MASETLGPGDKYALREQYYADLANIRTAKAILIESQSVLKPNDPAVELDFLGEEVNKDDVDGLIAAFVKMVKDEPAKAYQVMRDAHMVFNAVTKQTKGAFDRDAEGHFDEAKASAKSENTMLTNFRVRTATSSQMINYSLLRFNSAGLQDVDFKQAPDEYRTVYFSSRMGLALTHSMGEYIVGAWCIGNVLDTSASRAVIPGAGSNIGVRTAPNSMAHNLNVNIDWWDSDRLWRNFCNIEDQNGDATLTPRHVQTNTNSVRTKDKGLKKDTRS